MGGAESVGEYFIENTPENIKSFKSGNYASKYKACSGERGHASGEIRQLLF